MIIRLPILLLLALGMAFPQTTARDLYFESEDSPAPAIRINIRKQTRSTRPRSVPPSANFASGDSIHFEVSSRTAGHLYLVAHGSDDSWSVMFPGPDRFASESKVTPRQPVRTSATFDDKPGAETVYFVFTRDPFPSPARLLANLRRTPDSAIAATEQGSESDNHATFATTKTPPLITRLIFRHQ